ncbi:MAG: BCSC C-terminal domain-containing protein [Gammaproteobacteria bacterium]|nr:BCSC C-terminal domain-containing protein [Gammaproteobacteria bacterium]
MSSRTSTRAGKSRGRRSSARSRRLLLVGLLVLSAGALADDRRYLVFGSFADADNAQALKSRLERDLGLPVRLEVVESGGQPLQRVLAGPFEASRVAAIAASAKSRGMASWSLPATQVTPAAPPVRTAAPAAPPPARTSPPSPSTARTEPAREAPTDRNASSSRRVVTLASNGSLEGNGSRLGNGALGGDDSLVAERLPVSSAPARMLPPPGRDDDNPEAVRRLAEQARFWEQRNRPGLARDSWERLLEADPRNEEALARLALLAYGEGESARGDQYAERLARAAPNSRHLEEVRRGRSLLQIDGDRLEQARRAAADNRTSEALELYRRAFAGDPPTDALALEYFQVMTGVPERREEALRGLARLAERNPNSPEYALAHAREMTNRATTRREGIRRLRVLHGEESVREEALAGWRQALIWLDASPDDLDLYEQYLSVAPRDSDIVRRRNELRALQPGSPERQRDSAIEQAFAALDSGNLDAAERTFSGVLDGAPRNADALGGMGLVRLRQGRYADAQDLLEQAGRAQPRTASRWRNALRSARFFRHFEAGQAAAQAGNHSDALDAYRRAFDEPPDGLAPDLHLTYADALLRMDEFDAAESELRGVLARRPDNIQAQRMLAQLLSQTGRVAEAEELVAGAPQQVQAAIAPARATALRERAQQDVARGDRRAAIDKLREALTLAPESPWIRLDLARLLREEGRTREADDLLASLQRTHGNLPEVRLARAYGLAEQQRWLETLYELEELPARDRDRDSYTLQRRAWINHQLERASVAANQGDERTARRLLEAADRAADGDREYLGALARGWASVGDPARALDYMRRSFRDEAPTTDERLQYSGLLLELGHNTEFEAVVDQLIGDSLNAGQQEALEEQVVGYRIRLADAAREDGDLGGAYDLLRDVAQRRPRDPRVQLGLARIFMDAGDHDRALSLYDAVLRQDEDNREAVYGSAEAALSLGDLNLADRRVRDARRLDPEAPQAHELAGRLAEARGQTSRAIRHYEQAERQRQRRTPSVAEEAGPPRLQLIDRDEPVLGTPDRFDPPARRQPPLRPRPNGQPTALLTDPDPVRPAERPRRLSQETVTPLPPRPSERRVDPAPIPERSVRESRPAPAEPRPTVAASDAAPRGTAPIGLAGTTAPGTALGRLQADASGWVGGGLHARIRDGESGLGQLANFEVPMELRSSETRAGRFGLQLVPVVLNAGTVSGDATRRFGTLPLELPDEDFSASQSDSGVAAALLFTRGSLALDLGVTPLGFERERLTGGVRWRPSVGNWRLGVELARRPVTESLLAYAGTRDPLLGVNWGGINRNRIGFDVTYDMGDYGVYGSLGWALYEGRRVDDNMALDGGAGFYMRGWESERHRLTYGVNLSAFGYQKNRKYFTLGHGGYFSPDYFFSVGVPVELAGDWGALQYRVYGSLGVQSFREDAVFVFPSNPILQAELEATIADDPDTLLVSRFPSASQTGLGYALGFDLEYAMSPQMFIGGNFFTDNARDFNEFQFSVYLRYYFREQYQRGENPRLLPGHYNWNPQ